MDPAKTKEFVEKEWDATVVPTLIEFINVPNLSPQFDADVLTNGLMEKAFKLIQDWVEAQKMEGLTMELLQLPGKTPTLFIEVAATNPKAGTVFLYGHADKQPPFEGWNEGLAPYKAVLQPDGKLYGRGGADDGYACFSAISAIAAVKAQGQTHGRCVILIEGSEESGSPDLPDYITHLRPRIGEPELIVCLDSGAGDYKRLWVTASLRGISMGTLHVSIIKEGVHSGDASGVVPDTFRIARHLLSRIEDPETGVVKVPELNCEIPKDRSDQIAATVGMLGDEVVTKYPFLEGAGPVQAPNNTELALNRAWRPQLTVTGAGGLPSLANAGNVLRPTTSLKLSMRLPPIVSPDVAAKALKAELERDPPYGAKVTYDPMHGGSGYNAPVFAPWLHEATEKASQSLFGNSPGFQGEGGSIPFLNMLGEMFPNAQFLITGVLGPNSNAHGPNEFLHVPFAKTLTACVAHVVAAHSAQHA